MTNDEKLEPSCKTGSQCIGNKCLQCVVPDDSNLAQCEWCGWVVDWDDVPRARDLSGEIVTCCENCNEGESFVNYPSKRYALAEKGA